MVYRAEEAGRLSPVPFRAHEAAPAFCGGGGGLVSTADDYLKFARALLNDGEVDGVRLLKPETVQLMRRFLTDGDWEVGDEVTAVKLKDSKDRLFFRKAEGRWFLENRKKSEK